MSGPFEMLGASDVPVCAEGVCAMPDRGEGPASEAAAIVAGQRGDSSTVMFATVAP